MGADLSSLKKALVMAQELPPSLRMHLRGYGVQSVLQCYAVGDLGHISYESDATEGMIVYEPVIAEIVRPGSGEPGAEGNSGKSW
jgi:phenylacetate-CoA ligase